MYIFLGMSSIYLKAVLNPTFGEQEISSLDVQVKSMLDLSKKLVFPGYVGLNNIKANDYVNVVVQSLAHIRPLRNFFLRMCELETRMPCSHLARCFGELVRRMWNSRPFKGQVSPHELLQVGQDCQGVFSFFSRYLSSFRPFPASRIKSIP